MTTTTLDRVGDRGEVEVAWAPKAMVPSGIAVAALMGAMAGMLTLALVNVFTAASPAFNTWVHSVGKLWMPGAEGIGPYSGKETLAALGWLGSWAVLHGALRRRELDLSRWLIVFLLGVGVATTLIWPPVFEYLAGH
ncbi:MAG TPA: hypothetical protein VGT02_12830 [Methylomirabilota bacterium]|jgi:hypothetical protein|nr:hypothetical protein [Methylomirabilota bacterium]